MSQPDTAQKHFEELTKWAFNAHALLMAMTFIDNGGTTPEDREAMLELVSHFPEFLRTEADQFFGVTLGRAALAAIKTLREERARKDGGDV